MVNYIIAVKISRNILIENGGYMSSKNQNVVRMEQSSSKKNDDFAGLKSSLGFLDWALQVQTLIQASGLPIGDGLMDKETQLPIGSMASNFGHKTLGNFITGLK